MWFAEINPHIILNKYAKKIYAMFYALKPFILFFYFFFWGGGENRMVTYKMYNEIWNFNQILTIWLILLWGGVHDHHVAL